MRLVLTIARHECRDMLRDRRFAITSSTIAALLLAAAITGWSDWRRADHERSVAEAATRQHWLGQGARNPHSAAHFGIYALKRQTALAFADPGLDPFLGRATYVEAHYQNPARYRAAEDATLLARFAQLTAAFTLQILVPLLIVIAGFSTFSGERESGVLRQALSLGVRPAVLAAGKSLGLAAALAMILVPAAIIGSAVVLMVGSTSGDALAARIALAAGGYILYFVAWIALTIGASAVARSARASLIGLLGVWVAMSFLIPIVAADLSERLHPTPAASQFWAAVKQDLDEGIDGHNPRDRRVEALKQRMLAQYRVTKVEDLPFNFSALSLLEGEKYGDRVYDEHHGRLWSLYDKQESVHRVFSALAPSMAAGSLSMAAAGNDLAAHRDFVEQTERYRRHINRQLNTDYMRMSPQRATFVVTPDYWRHTPRFVHQPLPIGRVLEKEIASLGVLLGWAVVSMLFAVGATRRLAQSI